MSQIKILFCMILGCSFLLFFQNCGKVTSSSVVPVTDATTTDLTVVSKSHSLKLWESVAPISVYVALDENGEKQLVVDGLGSNHVFVKFDNVSNYDDFLPKVFQVTVEKDQPAHFFILSNDGLQIAHVFVLPSRVEVLWEVELSSIVSDSEFNLGRVNDTAAAAPLLVIGNQQIMAFNSSAPNFVMPPQASGSCGAQQHLENNLCVENNRVCGIANGTGSQQWMNNMWSACSLNSCNSGYLVSGNTCAAIVACNAGQHAENNMCVANTRSCMSGNQAGTETWANNIWGACLVPTVVVPTTPVLSLAEQTRKDYQPCANNYVLVLSGDNSTAPLCVMKYEARWRKLANLQVENSTFAKGNGYPHQPTYNPVYNIPAGFVDSTHEGLPMKVNRYTVTRICQHTGLEKELYPFAVTNNVWQEVAQQIEMTPENWSQGQVGTGQLNVGKTPQAATAVDANSVDAQSCYGTGANCTLTQWNKQRRTHRLPSGDIIWDFSGNVAEMVNSTIWYDMGGEATGTNLTKVPIAKLTETVSCTATTCPVYAPFMTAGSTPKKTMGPKGNYSSSTEAQNYAGLGTNGMLKKFSDQRYNQGTVLDNHWSAQFIYPIRGEDGIFGVSFFTTTSVWIEEGIITRSGGFRCAYYPKKK